MGWLNVIFTGVVATSTVAVAWLTYRLVKTYENIDWWTGSMESYSRQLLRLEAHKQGLDVYWWDPHQVPDGEPKWPKLGSHREKDRLTALYLGIRREERAPRISQQTRKLHHRIAEWLLRH